MKQASYEDEFSAGVCPILEDTDLEEMTDEQLQEELSNWVWQASDDCPLWYVVEDNIRLVERHIELRGMSDEDLARDLDQAEWAVGYWTEKFAEDNCPRTRNTIAYRKRQAEDYRRELARRARPEVGAVEDDATTAEAEDMSDHEAELAAEVDNRTDVDMSFPWKTETVSYLRDLALRASQLAGELGYSGVVWSVRTISHSLSGGRVRFGNMDDAINATRSVLAALVGDDSHEADELRQVVRALDHRLCDLEVEGQIAGYGNAI